MCCRVHCLLMPVLLSAWTILNDGRVQAETGETQLDYAKARPETAEKVAEFRLVKELGHPEAFRIEVETGHAVIEAQE